MLLDGAKHKQEILTGIGERLRGVREKAGYTVGEMCGLLNTTETHYTGMENGDYCMSCDRMITMKGVFGIELDRKPVQLFRTGWRLPGNLKIPACSLPSSNFRPGPYPTTMN